MALNSLIFLVETVLNAPTKPLDLRAHDVDDFLLLSRGFHWVNEEPFDR